MFTGLFSVVFLNKTFFPHHWLGSVMIAIGAALIGGIAALAEETGSRLANAPNPLLGDFFAIAAQFFRPGQYILEEKVVSTVDCTVAQAVGWEGFWGVITTVLAYPIVYSVHLRENVRVDDIAQAWQQMGHSHLLVTLLLLLTVNSGLYNFVGISVTRRASATMRAVINAIRTCSIWIVSLQIGWETFYPLQLAGFICLIAGSLVFNGTVSVDFLFSKRALAARAGHLSKSKQEEAGKHGHAQHQPTIHDDSEAAIVRRRHPSNINGNSNSSSQNGKHRYGDDIGIEAAAITTSVTAAPAAVSTALERSNHDDLAVRSHRYFQQHEEDDEVQSLLEQMVGDDDDDFDFS
eukprot:TRINITY_DN67725_c3_g1_i1.p2 TRINITY_DN67725_c3_g1~~TRINITY_DN67725_c3_g1_i1.p2  ORF type:complete len:349 (-),score=161.89 TRINITY_DN67725_c3_g1_i1:49-1095(-)